MKTKSWALTALVFLIATIGYANKFPKLNVVQVEKQKVLIEYKATFNTPLEVSISNDDGEVIFYKKVKNSVSQYQKVFDITEFRKGNYSVCINYGNQSINRKMYFYNNKLEVGSTERLFEPCLITKEKKLNISFLNIPEKRVFLSIYQNGELLVGVNLGKQMTIQKCINLKNFEKGNYKIVVTDMFKEHSFFVRL